MTGPANRGIMFIPTSTVLHLQPQAYMSMPDPISPGQPLQVAWEIYAPRGLPWGTASATVEFEGTVLYESGALPNGGRYGQFDVGEQDISIAPPGGVAGDFYRLGDHQLHLIVRGGDGGQTYGGVFTYSVVRPSINVDWWQWTPPSPSPDVPVNWNIPFSLAGSLNNPTDALFHATFALIEAPVRSTDPVVERQRITQDVSSGGNPLEITFDQILKNWPWVIPTGTPIADLDRRFSYVARITLTDEFDNPPYPQFDSAPLVVDVQVPVLKIAAAAADQSATVFAIAYAAAGLAALAGVITAPAAAGFFAISAVFAAIATASYGAAIDPPAPDPKFNVPVKINAPKLPKALRVKGAGSELAAFLQAVLEIYAYADARSRIEGKILGAESAGDRKGLAAQKAARASTRREMLRRAQRLPALAQKAQAVIDADKNLTRSRIAAGISLWKGGASADELRAAASQGLGNAVFTQLDDAIRFPEIAERAQAKPLQVDEVSNPTAGFAFASWREAPATTRRR